jgi:diacylglycerol kinase (ATP)
MNSDVESKLRAAYADHLIVDFDPNLDFDRLVAPRALVVVAGGDGTIEFVVRKLADSEHTLGILPLGTFNNLARALKIPDDLDDAIEVTRRGHPRQITVGRVNGHIFVEACTIGLFGDAIVLGEAAKDLAFGELGDKLRQFLEAEPFRYELSGDLEGAGTAMSLVFSNTASVGSNLPVSDASPIDPYLEFSADAGQTRADILSRVVASALWPVRDDEPPGRLFRFRMVHVETRPAVRVYADNQLVGETPADVAAEVSALKVMVPDGGNHK